jgi:hypothetical protein
MEWFAACVILAIFCSFLAYAYAATKPENGWMGVCIYTTSGIGADGKSVSLTTTDWQCVDRWKKEHGYSTRP